MRGRLIRSGRKLKRRGQRSGRKCGTHRPIASSEVAGDSAQAQLKSADAEIARLRAALNALEIQAQARNIFLANLSHELRTPLNAVIGFAEVLSSGAIPPEAPAFAQFLNHICKSGRNLLRLINDVLVLARLDVGTYDFQPERLDLKHLIDGLLDVCHTQIVRKRLAIAVEISPELGAIIVDPASLKQSVMAYLSDAIHSSADGGQIAVRALPEGDTRFRIEVEYQEGAVSRVDPSQVFVEFARVSGGHAEQSAPCGVGLALTRRLVLAQGGEVGARSEPSRGCIFFLVLDRVLRSGGSVGTIAQADTSATVPTRKGTIPAS